MLEARCLLFSPSTIIEADATPWDDFEDRQSRPLLGVDNVFNDPQYAGVRGGGYSVVILDGPIQRNHPYFGPDNNSNGIGDRIVYSYDFFKDDANVNVPAEGSYGHFNRHGMQILSAAAGYYDGPNVTDAQGNPGTLFKYQGIAPEANIIHLQVSNPSGDGGMTLTGNLSAAEEALQWVAANVSVYNISAVNMSFSARQPGRTEPGSNYSTAITDILNDELQDLHDDRVMVTASAGNQFCGFRSAQGVAYPAAEPFALAVGGTWDANWGGSQNFSCNIEPPFLPDDPTSSTDFTTNADRIMSMSQRHSTLLDIFAPGAEILGAKLVGTSQGLYGSGGGYGTSFAAPQVAGMAVLAQQLAVRETGQRLTFEQFRDLLRSTGKEIYDGDEAPFGILGPNDENDSVTNTNTYYRRADMLALANQLVAPKVSAVKIGSSSGSVAHADYTVPVRTGDQLKTVPVGSPNEIMITFTEAVDVVKGDLTVVGADSGTTYNVGTSTFNYNSTTKTAKWTFASAFPADQLVITLDDGVTDTAMTANALDGEWSNPAALSTVGSDVFPSGNGTAGGDFIFRVTILPGDVTRNNIVDLNDLNIVVNNQGLATGVWTQGEMTGDNLVNLADKNLVNGNFARNYSTWPGGGMMMMMMMSGGGEETGEAAMREALLDLYFARLANPKSDIPYAGLLGSSVLGGESWWNELLADAWERRL